MSNGEKLYALLESAFAPEVIYWTTPDPINKPDQKVLLIKRTNTPMHKERVWSTHFWNGTFLLSGHYMMTKAEAYKDFDERSNYEVRRAFRNR